MKIDQIKGWTSVIEKQGAQVVPVNNGFEIVGNIDFGNCGLKSLPLPISKITEHCDLSCNPIKSCPATLEAKVIYEKFFEKAEEFSEKIRFRQLARKLPELGGLLDDEPPKDYPYSAPHSTFSSKFKKLKTQSFSGETRLPFSAEIPLILGADLKYLSPFEELEQIFYKKFRDFLNDHKKERNDKEICGNKIDSICPGAVNLILNNFWEEEHPQGGLWDDNLPDNCIQGAAANDIEPTIGRSLDYLAYYRPAHFISTPPQPAKFGIFFKKGAISKEIHDAIELLPPRDEKLQFYLALLIFYHVFAHEVCHAWVEDIVSMVEFQIGNSDVNIYSATQERFRSFIALEESICETAGYGWVMDCLHKSLKNKFIKKKEYEKLKNAYRAWLRNCTEGLLGYENYRPIGGAPVSDRLFMAGMRKMIVCMYSNRDRENSFRISKSIGDYFSVNINCPNRSVKFALNEVPVPGIWEYAARVSKSPWTKVVPRDWE